MATQLPRRPLASLTRCLRELSIERSSQRAYANTTSIERTPAPFQPRPHNFHPGNIYRNHREKQAHFRPLPVPAPPPAIKKTCPDPVASITSSTLSTLDPTGARARLFSAENPERVRVGDILLVRLGKGAEPVSGVVLAIRRKTPVDTAILLRNQLTRVSVETWIKIYSPGVTGIEVVQRKDKRARRNKLFYYRNAKHDLGSLDGVVRGYVRQRQGLGQQSASTKTKQKGRRR